MANNKTTPAVVVTGVSSIPLDHAPLQLAFFDESGAPFDFSGAGFNVIAAVPNVTTANATDDATAWALANALKASWNDYLTKARAAGILAP